MSVLPSILTAVGQAGQGVPTHWLPGMALGPPTAQGSLSDKKNTNSPTAAYYPEIMRRSPLKLSPLVGVDGVSTAAVPIEPVLDRPEVWGLVLALLRLPPPPLLLKALLSRRMSFLKLFIRLPPSLSVGDGLGLPPRQAPPSSPPAASLSMLSPRFSPRMGMVVGVVTRTGGGFCTAGSSG